jgi:hypothetical protein
MGPQDVVSYIMQALTAEQDDAWPGHKTLLSFAVKCEDKAEDVVGQLQPGFFDAPGALADYFRDNPRYATLNEMSEWKPMGPPQLSNMSRNAAAKMLIRREGANWEEFFMNMVLADMPAASGDASLPPAIARKRWLITSIYKQGTA